MHTARTLHELIDQLLLRKTPFFLVFFVVVFATYTFLYAIDFYPEPKQTNATSAVGSEQSDDEDEPYLADTQETQPETVRPTENTGVGQSFQVTIDESDASDTDSGGVVAAEPTETTSVATPGQAFVGSGVAPVLPDSMYIERLDRTVPVLNPASRDIDVLDTALLSGTVRHPDSADLANTGNIFILGHSSYLPNVFNKNFQAFNGIQELEWGDRIVLTADGQQYVYRVERVYEAQAADVIVPHTPGDARLTLATCDSFGSKDDRFIVEARLVGSAT